MASGGRRPYHYKGFEHARRAECSHARDGRLVISKGGAATPEGLKEVHGEIDRLLKEAQGDVK